MLNKALLPLLLTIAAFPALALDTRTFTYLVRRAEHFPQDRYAKTLSPLEYRKFIDTGVRELRDAEGQPFRLTQYELSCDGRFALWTVTVASDDEEYSRKSMEDKKYIELLAIDELRTAYDPRSGAAVRSAHFTELQTRPTDFYCIEESTATP